MILLVIVYQQQEMLIEMVMMTSLLELHIMMMDQEMGQVKLMYITVQLPVSPALLIGLTKVNLIVIISVTVLIVQVMSMEMDMTMLL